MRRSTYSFVYHPKGNLEIKNDWDSLGMRGTASNSIIAKDVFVPSHRVIDFSAPQPAPTHSGPPDRQDGRHNLRIQGQPD